VNNDFGGPAIKNIPCPKCIERRKAGLAKEKAKVEKIQSKHIKKDIYQMERDLREEEVSIQKSLSPEEWDKYYALVETVEKLAESWSYRKGNTKYGGEEEDILHNILIAVTWRAAKAYNPAKSAFKTWATKYWSNEIKEFLRVERRVVSLHAPNPFADFNNEETLEDNLKNENSPSPEDCLIFDEETAWSDTTLNSRSLIKMMLSDTDQWLCPFCARTIKGLFRKELFTAKDHRALPQIFGKDVYARRRLLLN
jgi:DNA-directed RNA polymerase specialized sigma24 family protein